MRAHQAQHGAGLDGVAAEMEDGWILIMLEVELIELAKGQNVEKGRQNHQE